MKRGKRARIIKTQTGKHLYVDGVAVTATKQGKKPGEKWGAIGAPNSAERKAFLAKIRKKRKK